MTMVEFNWGNICMISLGHHFHMRLFTLQSHHLYYARGFTILAGHTNNITDAAVFNGLQKISEFFSSRLKISPTQKQFNTQRKKKTYLMHSMHAGISSHLRKQHPPPSLLSKRSQTPPTNARAMHTNSYTAPRIPHTSFIRRNFSFSSGVNALNTSPNCGFCSS